MTTVPPGGFAGYSQMTPASQRSLSRGNGGGGMRRKRAKKKAKVTRKRRRSSGKKLKKGSAAAKARMAKLRKMRKK